MQMVMKKGFRIMQGHWSAIGHRNVGDTAVSRYNFIMDLIT